MAERTQPTKGRLFLLSVVAAGLMGVSLAYVVSVSSDETIGTLAFLAPAGIHARQVAYVYAAATVFVFTAILYALLTRLPQWLEAMPMHGPAHLPALSWRKKSVMLAWVIIALAWCPVLYLAYPGSMTPYDTPNMIYEVFTSSPTYLLAMHTVVDASYVDHHPVLDALIYGGFIGLGRQFGSDALGLLLYVVVQALFTSFVYALAVCYQERLRVPWKLRLAALALVAVFPTFSTNAMIMMKDATFMPWWVLFVMGYIELFRTKGDAVRSWPFVAGMIGVAALCILTRKLGLLQVSTSLVVAFLVLKGVRFRVGGVLASALLIAGLIVPLILFPRLDVVPGGRQEVLGPLLQQTTTLALEHPEAMTDDDIACVNKLVDFDVARSWYNPTLTDAAKISYKENVTTQDLVDYLAMWLRQGVQHPLTYTRSLARCTAFLVVPGRTAPIDMPLMHDGIDTIQAKARELGQDFSFDVERAEFREAWLAKLTFLFEAYLAPTPLVGMLTTTGFWGGWLPFICAVLVVGRKWRNIAAMTPFIVSVGLLAISPGMLPRYTLPLMSVAILMMGWVVYTYRASDDTQAAHRVADDAQAPVAAASHSLA